MPSNFAVSALAAVLLATTAATASAAQKNAPEKFETAVFAGGCFWTIEHDFELLPGVVKAESGYAGGNTPRPTYEGHDGYVESVKVTWDPSKTSYAKLVNRFWRMIDPTEVNRQACDAGPSYQTAIFVATPEQRRLAEASKAEIDTGQLKGRIATQIRPAGAFWPAEAWHQHFAVTHADRYDAYRRGCRRDDILKRIWGDDAEPVASERAGRR